MYRRWTEGSAEAHFNGARSKFRQPLWRIWFGHQEHYQRLTFGAVFNADRRGLGYTCQAEQYFLDFRRSKPLASDLERIIRPAA